MCASVYHHHTARRTPLAGGQKRGGYCARKSTVKLVGLCFGGICKIPLLPLKPVRWALKGKYMAKKIQMLACPNCDRVGDAYITHDTLGSWPECRCGLQICKHFHVAGATERDLDEEHILAVEAWNRLAMKVIPPDDR